MATKKSSPLTIYIFFLLAAVLLFSALNTPNASLRQASEFNVLLLGSLGWMAILGAARGGESILYPIRDAKDLLNDTSLGVIVGVVSLAVVTLVLGLNQAVHNLFGSVTVSGTTVLGFWDIFILVVAAPIAETVLIVGLVRVVKEIGSGFLPKLVASLAAIAVTVLAFSAFHFNAYGKDAFPFDLNGFAQFLFAGNGALAQVALGVVLIVSALAFKSWIVPFVAHLFYNAWQVAVLYTGFFDATVFFVLVIVLLVFAFVFQQNRLSELRTFDWQGVFG